MPSCFAPGCTSGNRNDATGHHFFKPPRDASEFKRWEQMLHRKDRRLSHTSKICELHFEHDDIIKDYKHVVNGQEVRIPRGNWTLVPGAVPRLFSGVPDRFSKPKIVKFRRKSPKTRAVMQTDKCEDPCSDSTSSSCEPCVEAVSPNELMALSRSAETSTTSTALTIGDLATATLPSTEWQHDSKQDEITGKVCAVFYCIKL
uniref:THAP-type domain-containing protein n=1 Tax=Amblyomma cajennense TaxID=34607 RepID=A0A023FNK0_AMBCJ